MKVSIDIPDELYREVKIAAAKHKTTIKDLVAEGLKLILLGEGNTLKPEQIQFPLIDAGTPGTLTIADDAANQLEVFEDSQRVYR